MGPFTSTSLQPVVMHCVVAGKSCVVSTVSCILPRLLSDSGIIVGCQFFPYVKLRLHDIRGVPETNARRLAPSVSVRCLPQCVWVLDLAPVPRSMCAFPFFLRICSASIVAASCVVPGFDHTETTSLARRTRFDIFVCPCVALFSSHATSVLHSC